MNKPATSYGDSCLRIGFLLATGFLIFFSGAICVYLKYPPYNLIQESNWAVDAFLEKRRAIEEAYENLRSIKRIERPTAYNASEAFNGYTLYSGDRSHAYLIDMDGHVTYEWSALFSHIWKEHPHVTSPVSDDLVMWKSVKVYPNGNLLICATVAHTDTPYGYGVAMLDKYSQPIWHYDVNTHHDITVANDGTIYVPVQRLVDTPKELNRTFVKALEDGIAVISPQGQEITRFYLLDSFIRSPYSKLLKHKQTDMFKQWDILHVNSIVPLEPDMAKAFPMFKPGQVLLSIRNLDLLAVIDIATQKIVWAKRGHWRKQHHATFLRNGTIMLFDNVGKARTKSRILSYDPKTDETKTLYEAGAGGSFFSSSYGYEQLLPNNNLLITESKQGRIFEVTPDGRIVWEFFNPLVKFGHEYQKPVLINMGERYAPEDVPFLQSAASEQTSPTLSHSTESESVSDKR